MQVQVTDYGTRWQEIAILMRPEEIDALSSLLEELRKGNISHVQASSDYTGEGGIGEITFFMQTDVRDELVLLGPPIDPTR